LLHACLRALLHELPSALLHALLRELLRELLCASLRALLRALLCTLLRALLCTLLCAFCVAIAGAAMQADNHCSPILLGLNQTRPCTRDTCARKSSKHKGPALRGNSKRARLLAFTRCAQHTIMQA